MSASLDIAVPPNAFEEYYKRQRGATYLMGQTGSQESSRREHSQRDSQARD